ncbi:amidohydrolase [Pseudochryseolinea flava]|uniref:Amidohydrolase n=1 Tax=Pseudochryseolinea flava TaxID=2059302 RepID=A0A364Y3L3_9BACT|nr:amidohydrolase [Pseudochryseolinea flava]RAW00934.1 amidohydrolase [Pseudochryseolinea flava]
MIRLHVLALSLFVSISAAGQVITQIENYTARNYASLASLYQKLHQFPELSLQEKKTSAIMAQELKQLGFEVIENIGGYSLAGVFVNGDGPTVLIRTDMDALPLKETTGLPYASQEHGINAAGQDVSIMHACGHDIHMTVFIGTARALVAHKKNWHGTLVMVAQASEENGMGAAQMFKGGLYEKIPTPDYALALHDNATLAAGKIGYNTGAFMASVDMMDITVFGKGGHGAAPHTTVDPIVLSAQMIMAFQTIVSREINPLEPAVITVGSIHGGTVHNIIPDQVKMQLTLRSYSSAVREQILTAIKKKSHHLAALAGVPEDKMPAISIVEPTIPATINDKALTTSIVNVFQQTFGTELVEEISSSMVGEDFSRFALQGKDVPICMFWLGAADPEEVKRSKENGTILPQLHTANFKPLVEPTIKTGVKAMCAAVLHIFKEDPKEKHK